MTTSETSLAIHGGKPAKTTPYGTGSRFGREEEEAATAAIRSQKLWYKQGGTRVAAAEKTISEMWKTRQAVLCSSGTAAVHTALVMCGVEPGDEVIVNPLSDWGSVAGILALGATPVFCDIEEDTYSLDVARVEAAITGKTRAIEVVHLSGYPARIREIVAIAHRRGLKVIEDCAQSPLATLGGKALGTFGDVGAFSTNDSKHISCGEGGFVITDDEDMARVARLFIDKAYEKNQARGQTDVAFLGMNYRQSELHAAVLDAQLRKLPRQLERRRAYAERLLAGIAGVEGYRPLKPSPDSQCGYWMVLGRLELEKLNASRDEITKALSAEKLSFWAALAPARTLYGTRVLHNGTLYPHNRTGPASFLKGREWPSDAFPVAERVADSVICFMVKEFYTERDADETAEGIRKVLGHYRK